MTVSPTVIVASADQALLDEVIRSLEDLPHWRLVGSASEPGELIASCGQQNPQVVLCDGRLAIELSRRMSRIEARLFIFDRASHQDALMAALQLQARGFVAWPQQRNELKHMVEKSLGAISQQQDVRSGTVVGVWAPKAGSGASTVAAHLAAAAVPHASCILVDLDLEHADQTEMFGMGAHDKDLTDLARVVDELSLPAIQSVSCEPSPGLRLILAPGPKATAPIDRRAVMKIVTGLSEHSDLVIADLPGADIRGARGCAAIGSLLMVVCPDLLSLRRARDAVHQLRSEEPLPTKTGVIINNYVRGEVTREDVEAVVGLPVVATIRPDPGMARAPSKASPSRSGIRLVEPVVMHLLGGERKPRRRRRSLDDLATPVR